MMFIAAIVIIEVTGHDMSAEMSGMKGEPGTTQETANGWKDVHMKFGNSTTAMIGK